MRLVELPCKQVPEEAGLHHAPRCLLVISTIRCKQLCHCSKLRQDVALDDFRRLQPSLVALIIPSPVRNTSTFCGKLVDYIQCSLVDVLRLLPVLVKVCMAQNAADA